MKSNDNDKKQTNKQTIKKVVSHVRDDILHTQIVFAHNGNNLFHGFG